MTNPRCEIESYQILSSHLQCLQTVSKGISNQEWLISLVSEVEESDKQN